MIETAPTAMLVIMVWVICIGYSAGAVTIALYAYDAYPDKYFKKFHGYCVSLIWPLVATYWIIKAAGEYAEGKR